RRRSALPLARAWRGGRRSSFLARAPRQLSLAQGICTRRGCLAAQTRLPRRDGVAHQLAEPGRAGAAGEWRVFVSFAGAALDAWSESEAPRRRFRGQGHLTPNASPTKRGRGESWAGVGS